MAAILQRQHFDIPRSSEYFDARELQAQTGQNADNFAHVILKELVDNALDAAETVRRAPEIEIRTGYKFDRSVGHHCYLIEVSDNGNGIPAEVVTRTLNYAIRVSDKAAWRSPTRGAQGNALKTIIGVPTALGGDGRLTIEACGIRHDITAEIGATGEPRIQHETEHTPTETGTKVSVKFSTERQLEWDPEKFIDVFTLANPHAEIYFQHSDATIDHGQSENDGIREMYLEPSVGFPDAGWRKFLPTDPTSAHWYTLDAFRRLLALHAEHSGDMTVRQFVQQFKGLTRPAVVKSVCNGFPVQHLVDMDDQCIEDLFQRMKGAATDSQPKTLGFVGKDHIRNRIDEWYTIDGDKFWYKRLTDVDDDGIPYVIEAAYARTLGGGNEPNVYTAVNFSPSYGDPIPGLIVGAGIEAHGVSGFIREGNQRMTGGVAFVHIVSPSLNFLDRGKSRIKVSPGMQVALGDALGHVLKKTYVEAKRRDKDATRASRQVREQERREKRQLSMNIKDAVFEVMRDGWAHATGDGVYPVAARSLYYQVRTLAQALTDKELKYSYFTNTLIPEFERANGCLKGLYYDPRGVLYEPHTNRAIPLGTREVEDYEFPAWRYNKVLYIEKKGLWPIVEASKIAQRYDLAVVVGEGYASTAARTLFSRASKDRGYKLFVLHDCDPYGYEIARTLGEATSRMPDHHIEIIDIGLKLHDALAMGLESEEYTRASALPETLVLTEEERSFFEEREILKWRKGKEVTTWVGRRVELNAMTAPQTIEFIVAALERNGATDKVIPDEHYLAAKTRADYDNALRRELQWLYEAKFRIDELVEQTAQDVGDLYDLSEARQWIEAKFKNAPTLPWDGALELENESKLSEHTEALEKAVDAAVADIS